MRFTVIGCGSLGAALVDSALQSGILVRENITLIERNENDRRDLEKRFRVRVQAELDSRTSEDETVLLAIKPKDLATLGPVLSAYVGGTKSLVISTLAGVSIQKLQTRLSGHTDIVRVMPNLGVQVNLGVTGIFSPDDLPAEKKYFVTNFFSASGLVIPVEKESLLDVLTAMSGSGPAYICALLEALEISAVSKGLSEAEVRSGLLQTLLATAKILQEREVSPEKLRTSVTSPGGVTEAALGIFKKREFSSLIDSALQASIDRSIELDKNA